FGGIAKLGDGLLPAEKVIMEHYRLGSTRAILSRTFCDSAKIESIEEIDRVFGENMQRLLEYENSIYNVSEEDLIKNKKDVSEAVKIIVADIKGKKLGNDGG
ncbi:MAG: aldolase, partial [Muribaculaceae bacterium]|nr:aldolase [Muribaculaceae bacterium]